MPAARAAANPAARPDIDKYPFQAGIDLPRGGAVPLRRGTPGTTSAALRPNSVAKNAPDSSAIHTRGSERGPEATGRRPVDDRLTGGRGRHLTLRKCRRLSLRFTPPNDAAATIPPRTAWHVHKYDFLEDLLGYLQQPWTGCPGPCGAKVEPWRLEWRLIVYIA